MPRFLLTLAFLAIWPLQASAQTELLLGADNPGGSYYLYGGGLSNWVNQHSKTIRLTSQTTRGSVENARLLASHRLAFGLVNALAVYQQAKGIGQFKGQQSDNLRGIAVLDMAPIHIVAYASSGIKTTQDLVGKTVSIGAPGSGSASAVAALFPIAQLTGKVRTQNLGFSESASNMRDGSIDAFIAASALPMPSIVDLASANKIALIPLSEADINSLHEQNPPYESATIPANTYPGVDRDVQTIGVASLLMATDATPDEAVTEILRQMYPPEALAYIRSIYKAWAPESGQNVFGSIGVPMHPAALRFYKEKGLIK
jgi:TRAP transporter TAXI family solute receptor